MFYPRVVGGCILLGFYLCFGPPVRGTASALPVVPHLEVVPPLEVLMSVIYLELEVIHRWDVGKVAGVWAL